MHEALLQLFKNHAVKKGPEFTLASGQKSTVFVDCKKLTLYGPWLQVVSEACLNFFNSKSLRPTAIAGVTIGGDPLVAGVILAAAHQAWNLQGLLVRKEPKNHGATKGRAVEGVEAALAGEVWLLEDVITTGKSSLDAAQKLIQEGYSLRGILCLVDRELGGVEILQKTLGVQVHTLFRLSQF